MSELRLRLVRDPGELEALRGDWLKLLERSATNEPMLSPLWLLSWWRAYGQHRQLAVGLFYDGDHLAGLAPLQRRRYWYRPGIPFRRLEWLGADVDEQDGVCSEYLNVIASVGDEARVARAFAASVAGGAFGRWDEVVLPAMAADGPMTGPLVAAFQEAGFALPKPLIPVHGKPMIQVVIRNLRYWGAPRRGRWRCCSGRKTMA